MAGYWTYDEWEGESVHRMYRSPFMVRGTIDGEGVTVASFETMEKAQTFVNAGAGGWGKENVTIENWNE